jgi:hypothetical protein
LVYGSLEKNGCINYIFNRSAHGAGVAELADALDSKSYPMALQIAFNPNEISNLA